MTRLTTTQIIFSILAGLLIAELVYISVNAQELPEATSTPVFVQPIVKSDFEIISEFAERIVRQDLLLSKYAQKLDYLINHCK